MRFLPRSKAGWLGIGIYLVALIALMAYFYLTCEEIGCLVPLVLPFLPGSIPLLGMFPESNYIVILGFVINLGLAYWIGVGIGRLLRGKGLK